MTKIAKFFIVTNTDKFTRYGSLEEAEDALEGSSFDRGSVYVLEAVKGIRPRIEKETLEVAPPQEVTVAELRRDQEPEEEPPVPRRRNNRAWPQPLDNMEFRLPNDLQDRFVNLDLDQDARAALAPEEIHPDDEPPEEDREP